MSRSRRDLLATSAAALATAGLAGCNGRTNDEGTDGEETDDGASDSTAAGGSGSSSTQSGATATVEDAVAAEWNAMRARLDDALALGIADEAGAGAALAQDVFARFEEASGEYGAHEMLESTSEANYEEFEEALGELRTEGLEAGDVGRAREEATIASTQLAEAQRALAGEATANALDVQLLGVAVGNAGMLAAAGAFEAAATVAADVLARFEEAAVHDALEAAAPESYEAFEAGVEATAEAAGNGDGEAVRRRAGEAFAAAVEGSYALADAEAAAGAGHLAALQARGWDAAALASLGGPSTDYAHAAGLTIYRARVADAAWLAGRGETDRAATMVGDVFAHFEGARAHEALEEADGEAYEGFEAGLSELQAAIESGDAAGIEAAAGAVDDALVTGIGALAGANAPLLEASFFRARVADAREAYRVGETATAASIARGLFERFEANELDVHETVESTSEELYERFEEDHLSGLIDAFEAGDDAGVETHYAGVQSTLLEFATTAGSTATVSGGEGAYVAARGFDAAVLDALGDDARARGIAQGAFEHFESGAGGYHEALEEADESTYESFEEALGAVGTAAEGGEDVYPAAKRFNEQAVASVYAIVASAGGSFAGAAATTMQDVFGQFEEARVHELIEEADHNAYETFEGELEAYVAALEEGGDVAGAAESFARAAQYGGFALADAVEELPLALRLAGTSGGAGGDGEGGSGGDSSLQGGPNVVEGVPEDADHVVDMLAVAFEPKQLTVGQGDTVAWRFAGGEPHTVFAYEDGIPEGAEYWASGGFDSQPAAEKGWSNGTGAIQSGQSYVRTFETTGTHEYYCAPHEAAGMVGSVTVE
jgi:plastocyanin